MTRVAGSIAGGTAAIVVALLAAVALGGSLRAEDIAEAEVQSIGVDAYLYFYPLISMDVTRRQLTNVAPGQSAMGAPPNTFVNLRTFPTANMRAVVRPNFDTLYSSAWLDLTKEPMIVSVPDTGGRYYLLPMLDMWSDVFASPGWRTTGTMSGNFLIAPPGWRPDLREGLAAELKLPENTQRIDAPTFYVWLFGRTQTDGPQDYAAVHEIQAGYKITPLSQWGGPASPPAVSIDPSVDMNTPPKVQVDTMPPDRYFAYAAEILKLQPPHLTDGPILARMKRIGIERGKSFDLNQAGPVIRRALERAPDAARNLMLQKAPTIARNVNGWLLSTDTVGVYGNYYLKRAMVAYVGLGANLPEDAVYPLNLGDVTGKPLIGSANYTLRFAKDQLPPTDAFWSVTLYDEDGFQVANELNRFAVSSWMPLKTNVDGSLDLHIQNTSPGPEREANWLPSPKGRFTLTMRIYVPKSDVLTGEWDPPPIMRTN
jgi:hypothetical protein